jgi:hypothetical protein
LEAEEPTPKLLRLKLTAFEPGDFFLIYLFFIFILLFIFNPLFVSLMPVQLTVD